MKFKSQEHVDQLFELTQAATAAAKKRHTYFDVASLSADFRTLLESVVRKCLRFEPCARPSALELLLEVHEFIKKSHDLGIFSVYN